MINLYYRATYAYRVEEFDRLMVKMKSIHYKLHDEQVEEEVPYIDDQHSRVHEFLLTCNPEDAYHIYCRIYKRFVTMFVSRPSIQCKRNTHILDSGC
ncbi:hypothetical protein Ddye_028022 [Dipteronia dyeriana]|uniref:Uncharacterized protein n=1 Tax=Dipteronia dyeriana TaxID=168575 RepID=A0AAD9TQN8_9ROSI|nr:hypothetical protein Ddye_028022 [Dipteronia dyeriana]